jgi:hypothetical protein
MTHRSTEKTMSAPRKKRPLPGDPALWVWAAVALVALVPIGHAVASVL